ncbi:MAG TPA: ACP S-malonyltransferase [Clostridiaceae bacterium]|nr:ACP S-malonyltransferase [Clostridiaceae bacterium]
MKNVKNTNKWVFLYGGQGSQRPGMGIDFAQAFPQDSLYSNPYCNQEELDYLLAPDFDRIHETRYAQVALTVFALTVTRLLNRKNIHPAAALGLSAGEFPALAAANVYSPEATLAIIKRRAELMSSRLQQRHQQGYEDGMLVVLGLEETVLDTCLAPFPALSPANMNAKTQLTVSGPKADLELLRRKVLDAGAKRTLFLEVEGAFHSKVFDPDVAELRRALLAAGPAGKAQADLPLNILGRPVTEPYDFRHWSDSGQAGANRHFDNNKHLSNNENTDDNKYLSNNKHMSNNGNTDDSEKPGGNEKPTGSNYLAEGEHPIESHPIDEADKQTEIYADLMSRQMASPTRLDDCFTYLLHHGYTHFVEIAPQAVLTPLLRRRSADLNLRHIGNVEAFSAFISEAID